MSKYYKSHNVSKVSSLCMESACSASSIRIQQIALPLYHLVSWTGVEGNFWAMASLPLCPLLGEFVCQGNQRLRTAIIGDLCIDHVVEVSFHGSPSEQPHRI